eukprot:TRINITY_DN15190_c0_g1_i1.p1 TRINITY_DN15190_c0_g1~~TRINITY_DN15190_c0_g1_i1.p1  ORF type:complete len:196 (-),score=15.71 TRINITY_DN15190_c0_g1_i1:7-594(-)
MQSKKLFHFPIPNLVKDQFYRIRNRAHKDSEFCKYINEVTGYPPRNIQIYKQAFMDPSYKKSVLDNNLKLQNFGSSLLRMFVAEHLMKDNESNENRMTIHRDQMLTERVLVLFANRFYIDAHVKHSLRHDGVYGCGLQALVAAVSQDQGFARAQKFVHEKILLMNKQVIHKELNQKRLVTTRWSHYNKRRPIRFD